MTTKNPRITITLNPNHYRVVQSISAMTGKPMSAFIVEILDASMPTIERMAVTFQKIKNMQDESRSKFLETIDEAQSLIEPIVMEAEGQFDLFLSTVGAAADSHPATPKRARAPSAGPGAKRPASPRTNRGDTPLEGKRLKASGSKASRPVQAVKVLKKKGA